MSERPGQADELDDMEGDDCRPTVVPGMPGSTTISDRPSAVREVIEKAKAAVAAEGPDIEVSGETDVEAIVEVLEEEGRSELAEVGDDDIADSVNFLEGTAENPLPRDDSTALIRQFAEAGMIVVEHNSGDAEGQSAEVHDGGQDRDFTEGFDLDDDDFSDLLAETFPTSKEVGAIEDDIHFMQEGDESSAYVENEVPTMASNKDAVEGDSIPDGPPLEGGVGFVVEKPKSQMVTMPPPASEVDRILGRMEEQLAQAVVQYDKAERKFRKAESDKLALEEAINAFHARNRYCEDDLVVLVRGNDMDKAERILDVHDGFFSEELANVLILTRDGLRLFIDHIDSFSELGTSFIEELAKVEMDLDQISIVLKSLRNREKAVFFPKDEELEDGQLDSYIEIFLVKADRLVEKLRVRFSE